MQAIVRHGWSRRVFSGACSKSASAVCLAIWAWGAGISNAGETEGVLAARNLFQVFAGMPAPEASSFGSGSGAKSLEALGYNPRGIVEDYLAESEDGPTLVRFGSAFVPPIPANFFGPGSQPFMGQVEFVGAPLSPSLGDASAIIRRPGPPVMPGDPVGAMGMVPIEIVALNLVSVNAIVVTYPPPQLPEQWNVAVRLSPTPAPLGQLQATKTHPNGGVFNSVLFVQPLFTFTRVPDGMVRQLDTGGMMPPLRLDSSGDSFVHLVNPALGVIIQPGNDWVSGIIEVTPGDIDSQQEKIFDERTQDNGDSVTHTVCPAYQRVCIYRVACKDSDFKGACDNCPFTCDDICVTTNCIDTCPNYSNFCGGPNCCLDFTFIGCDVPPPGTPLCPGPGQPCTCAPQPGVCCDGMGFCSMVADQCECDAIGGRFIPGVAGCGPIVACCFDDGTCQNMSQVCCVNRGGVPLPAGASCGGALEACCLGDGTCIMTDPACCFFLFLGTPQGPGTACVPDADHRPCCLPDGTCQLVDPNCCDELGGTILPVPAACDGTTQACCFTDGSCQDADRDCCLQDGGTPQGVGTNCATVDCQPGGECAPLPGGTGCAQAGCTCFGECINGSYCDDPNCCLDPAECLCYTPHAKESIKLCGDCFGECIGGSYCDDVADPNCWIDPAGPACYVPNHEVSIYLCKDCFGQCVNGSYCDHPNPNCCIGVPCQCYPPNHPISLEMCPDVDRCEPRCALYNPFTDQTTVTDCDCVGWHNCHLDLPGGADGLAVVRGPGNPCVVTDAGGTVTLPPAGCEYLSPDDVHAIINGLPAGTTIELATIHKDFICNKQGTVNPVCTFSTLVDCEEPGGSLGGEKECVESSLDIQMTGTGMLAGFNRMITLPIGFETHTAPRMPGDPVQSFDVDMFRLFGQIPPGDPDFDQLRVTAGTDFGLPSPGHTTLTQLPGGNWAVDSFFDIEYRIDFVGAPGGPLADMMGSTTATIRMATGSGLTCVGQCPPGRVCQQNNTPHADGTITVCCDCVIQPPLDEGCCLPNAVGFGCVNALPADCLAMGGIPQGPGSLCSSPAPCCTSDGRCRMIDPLCCDELGGMVTPGTTCVLYGDITPKPSGDGFVDVGDVLKMLDGFSDPALCPQCDIAPCCGDGFIDVGDVLAVLDAFSGIPPCPDTPCPCAGP